MPIITKTTLECDLCDGESRPHEGAKPKGWLQVTVPNERLERDEVRCLCPECRGRINNATALENHLADGR